jgi:hypothetical protein
MERYSESATPVVSGLQCMNCSKWVEIDTDTTPDKPQGVKKVMPPTITIAHIVRNHYAEIHAFPESAERVKWIKKHFDVTVNVGTLQAAMTIHNAKQKAQNDPMSMKRADKIRELFDLHGATNEKLAEIMWLSVKTVSKIRARSYPITPEMFVRITKAFANNGFKRDARGKVAA